MRLGMPRLAWLLPRGDLALRKRSRLALEVDFGVDVGGVERCMSKPGSHGVDVDARIEQVRGRGVAPISLTR